MSPVFRRRDGVVERTVGPTSFLAVDDTGALYRLNETGTALWRLLDELLQESLIEVIGERQPSLPSGRSHR